MKYVHVEDLIAQKFASCNKKEADKRIKQTFLSLMSCKYPCLHVCACLSTYVLTALLIIQQSAAVHNNLNSNILIHVLYTDILQPTKHSPTTLAYSASTFVQVNWCCRLKIEIGIVLGSYIRFVFSWLLFLIYFHPTFGGKTKCTDNLSSQYNRFTILFLLCMYVM